MSDDVQATEDVRPEATAWRENLGFKEQEVIGAAKRLGVQWDPWMGDWFISWSPRNDNNNAEGTWDHWVDLACKILRDPLTAIVRPAAHEAAADERLAPRDFYSDSDRLLTDQELRARFAQASP